MSHRFIVLTVLLLVCPVFAQAQSARHVIIISIDGLHQSDLTDPVLKDRIPNILALAGAGVAYSNASGTLPSDSFPGTMAYITGAGPATTGVYYDDSYSRSLVAPGGNSSTPLGTPVQNTEVIDHDDALLNAGGDFGVGGLDPAKMVRDPARNFAPVFPHDYLKVNTIFEVAHAAGLRTSMIDKHPSYEIANGPSGKGVDDLYCPEIESKAAIVNGKLVDAQTDASKAKLKAVNKDVPLAMAYDDMKLAALIREIHGDDARGASHPGMPGLAAINFQAVNIAEKQLDDGGISVVDGKEVPSQVLLDALTHTDGIIAKIVSELKSAGAWDQTLLVFTAKHGQDPRLGMAKPVSPDLFPNTLQAAGVKLASATQDDVALLWLADSSQTAKAANALTALKSSDKDPGIDRILFGQSLADAGLAGPADRTPDLIVVLKPGVLISEKKRSDHGGFCEDDTHIPLILTGGLIPQGRRGVTTDSPVKTTQIAVTAITALGLDPAKLQGAQIEHTQILPGTGLESR